MDSFDHLILYWETFTDLVLARNEVLLAVYGYRAVVAARQDCENTLVRLTAGTSALEVGQAAVADCY